MSGVTGASARSTAWPAALAALALVLLVLGGCGIPTDDAPREFVLTDEQPANGAAGGTDAPPTGDDATIYLVGGDTLQTRLTAFSRDVPRPQPADVYLRAVLDQLIAAQPTSAHANNTTGLEIENVTIDDRIARLTIAGLDDIENAQQVIAVAQIVFTATEIPGIDGVVFLAVDDDGAVSERQVSVEEGESELGEPVTRDDFPAFRDSLLVAGSEGGTPETPVPSTDAVPEPTTTAAPTSGASTTATTATP